MHHVTALNYSCILVNYVVAGDVGQNKTIDFEKWGTRAAEAFLSSHLPIMKNSNAPPRPVSPCRISIKVGAHDRGLHNKKIRFFKSRVPFLVLIQLIP